MAKVRGDLVRFSVDYPKYMELFGRIKDVRIIDNEVFYYILCIYENDTQPTDVYRLVHQDNVY
jgi:hypothetical protein